MILKKGMKRERDRVRERVERECREKRKWKRDGEREREREREKGGETSYARKGIILKKDDLNNVFMLKKESNFALKC